MALWSKNKDKTDIFICTKLIMLFHMLTKLDVIKRAQVVMYLYWKNSFTLKSGKKPEKHREEFSKVTSMSFSWSISKEWQSIPWALGIYSAEKIKLSIKCTITQSLFCECNRHFCNYENSWYHPYFVKCLIKIYILFFLICVSHNSKSSIYLQINPTGARRLETF